MFQLRYYQEEAVCSLFNYFLTNSGNPVVALPTGTGKALVIAEFIRRALCLYPFTRILNVTHVKELVAQNHAELMLLWPSAPAGIYSAGLKRRDTSMPVTFCGIGSVAKRTAEFGRIDLVLIDECHTISDKDSTMYVKAIEALRQRNPLLKVIGLTATPYRTGMGMITEGKLFTDIVCDYCNLEKFNELVRNGFICPLIPKRTEHELSVEGVGITGGEYNQDELQAAVDKESITTGALQEAVMLGRGRRHGLVFCTGTNHADHARDILTGLGIPAVSVHSKLPGGDDERDRNINLFKGGYVGAMVGVGVFTTGFNFRPIDWIIVLRPTMSTVLWVQLLGRGTRPSPETGKKDCLVLDFAANTRRLGPINDPVIPRRKGKKGSGVVPYKTCPHCQTYNHARTRFCISCGSEFPESFAATTGAATEELIRQSKEEKPPPEPEPAPEVATWNVHRVEYAAHYSRDTSKPPSLRVSYYCENNRVFNEWLCLEHTTQWPRKRARDTWRLMAGPECDVPETIEDALTLVDALQPPSQIRVLMKTKFPEVVGYDFGTPGVPLPPPGVVTVDDDDIPF